jgi:dephospho-CoA kinase
MLRVGLTGGIGSGKSTVAALFAARGVPVIDTDEIARELVQPSLPAYREIVKHFGNGILRADQSLDRTKLRERVFGNASERERLESILHPRIREEVIRRLSEIRNGYGVVVVPLLIETGFDGITNRILVVDADEALRTERVVQRNGMKSADVRKIIATQATREQRLSRADDVIDNNGTPAELERQVDRLHQHYLTLNR